MIFYRRLAEVSFVVGTDEKQPSVIIRLWPGYAVLREYRKAILGEILSVPGVEVAAFSEGGRLIRAEVRRGDEAHRTRLGMIAMANAMCQAVNIVATNHGPVETPSA